MIQRVTHRIRAFANVGRTDCEYVWRVKLGMHGVGLTGINHEEYFIIAERTRIKKKLMEMVGRRKERKYRFF